MMAKKKVFAEDEGVDVDGEILTDGIVEGTGPRRIPHLPTGTIFSPSNPPSNGLGIPAIPIEALLEEKEEEIPDICEEICARKSQSCRMQKDGCVLLINGSIDID